MIIKAKQTLPVALDGVGYETVTLKEGEKLTVDDKTGSGLVEAGLAEELKAEAKKQNASPENKAVKASPENKSATTRKPRKKKAE